MTMPQITFIYCCHSKTLDPFNELRQDLAALRQLFNFTGGRKKIEDLFYFMQVHFWEPRSRRTWLRLGLSLKSFQNMSTPSLKWRWSRRSCQPVSPHRDELLSPPFPWRNTVSFWVLAEEALKSWALEPKLQCDTERTKKNRSTSEIKKKIRNSRLQSIDEMRRVTKRGKCVKEEVMKIVRKWTRAQSSLKSAVLSLVLWHREGLSKYWPIIGTYA